MPLSNPQFYFSGFIRYLFISVSLVCIPLASGQSLDDLKVEISNWVSHSASDFTLREINSPVDDLSELKEMVGEARIVAISESNHAAKEQMAFRNRAFKFLVEELGFEAIVLESGLVESQMLNDYVAGGEEDTSSLFERGFSNGFGQFEQNQELVNWIREYNLQLSRGSRKLQIFGFDVSGSPYYNDAARNPDAAIRAALEYLETVDSTSASEFSEKFDYFLPVLADIFGYGKLTQAQRDSLTSAINDLINLFKHRRFEFIEASTEREYQWGSQAAVGAQQIDNWFRQIPHDWQPSDGFDWNQKSQKIRDYAMLENLEWVLDQVIPGGRVVVFASVAHISKTRTYLAEDETKDINVPFGMYARERYGKDFVNILNMTVGGEIEVCFMPEAERSPMILQPPPTGSIESMFTVRDKPQYLIDLRDAPETISSWLQQEQYHWNGFGSLVFPPIPAFDIAYYLGPVMPDCDI